MNRNYYFLKYFIISFALITVALVLTAIYFLFHLAVAATQNYILDQYRKQDIQFEKAFYDDVRNIFDYYYYEKRIFCF
jgi:hypothetical protein